MRALQSLWAQMSQSNQSFVDPSALLRKLLDKDGKPVTIGNQEDIGGTVIALRILFCTFRLNSLQ